MCVCVCVQPHRHARHAVCVGAPARHDPTIWRRRLLTDVEAGGSGVRTGADGGEDPLPPTFPFAPKHFAVVQHMTHIINLPPSTARSLAVRCGH